MTRVFLFAALVLAVGCGGDDPTTPPPADALPLPREVLTESVLLGPRGDPDVSPSAEGIMIGGGITVIRLTAQGPMEWNIHGHAGGGTQDIHTEGNVTSAEYVFVPPNPGDWYLIVRNQDTLSNMVQFKLDLHDDTQWKWQ